MFKAALAMTRQSEVTVTDTSVEGRAAAVCQQVGPADIWEQLCVALGLLAEAWVAVRVSGRVMQARGC